MNRNQRRQAHDAKRSAGAGPLSEADRNLAREWSGLEESDLELVPQSASEKAERFHRENDRRALDQQVQAINLRDPLTREAY